MGRAADPPHITASRANGYQSVQKRGVKEIPYALSIFVVLSFLATPQGMMCLSLATNTCTAFLGTEFLRAHPYRSFFICTAVTGVLSNASFFPLAMIWDARYRLHQEDRCQVHKTHDVSGLFGRVEVRLAAVNLVLAAGLSALVALMHVSDHNSYDRLYMDVEEWGWGYLCVSCVAFFLWIDAWAYVCHRFLHLPFMYRTVHKVHHTWKQPTAFVALGLHPAEFLLMQAGVFLAFYALPLHPSVIALNLLYVHYHNVVDHSGVFVESWIPWQPSSLYHDDHHKLFHVNYGQTLTIFDQLGGTFYQKKKIYTERSFSY